MRRLLIAVFHGHRCRRRHRLFVYKSIGGERAERRSGGAVVDVVDVSAADTTNYGAAVCHPLVSFGVCREIELLLLFEFFLEREVLHHQHLRNYQ